MTRSEEHKIIDAAKEVIKGSYVKVIIERYPKYATKVDKLRNVWNGKVHDDEAHEMLRDIQVLTKELKAA